MKCRLCLCVHACARTCAHAHAQTCTRTDMHAHTDLPTWHCITGHQHPQSTITCRPTVTRTWMQAPVTPTQGGPYPGVRSAGRLLRSGLPSTAGPPRFSHTEGTIIWKTGHTRRHNETPDVASPREQHARRPRKDRISPGPLYSRQ